MRERRIVLVAAVLALLAAGPARGQRALTVVAGQASTGDLGETTSRSSGITEAYLAGVGAAVGLHDYGSAARWEAEVQLLKHFGFQHQWESTGALVLRWLALPWDRWVDTSVAVGDGLSWLSRTSQLEDSRHDKTERMLNYLFFEVTLAPPGTECWTVVLRQHHRSGVFGTYGGVRGGSDFLVLGLRRAL